MNRRHQPALSALMIGLLRLCASLLLLNFIPLPSPLVRGQSAPPIPKSSPLADPRSVRQVGVPRRVTQRVIPSDNPQTAQKSALGQKLFFERRLSADGSVACSTCHDPALAFTDARPASVGIKGLAGQRNSPTILNALYNKSQFWDGRVASLELQAALPIINPVEMGQPSVEAAVAAITDIGEYQTSFRKVFGRAPNPTDLVRAIASYERSLIAFDSPFDHFVNGTRDAIGEDAKRGWAIFNTRGRCNKCHALSEQTRDTSLFTDNDFHNIGIGIKRHNVLSLACRAEKTVDSGVADAIDDAAIQSDMSVLGRFLVTKNDADIASFKTPGLRNVLLTARIFMMGRNERFGTLWTTTTRAPG